MGAALVLLLFLLLPLLFANIAVAALAKLGLSPAGAFLALLGVFAGSLINVPVRTYRTEELVVTDPLAIFGLRFPALRRAERRTVLAVNVGGCVVPCALAAYEVSQLALMGLASLGAVLAASLANTYVCYKVAQPVPGVGIALPALIPGLCAAGLALWFAPDSAPPVAFVAGVLGPVVGADLLHLAEFRRSATGIVSVGGAGTFDGIVLSGLLATLLA